MLVIAEAAKRYDLSSLEIISYGTEPMPASTLAAVRETLPRVRLKQTYGLSELGISPDAIALAQIRSGSSWWRHVRASDRRWRAVAKVADGHAWLPERTVTLRNGRVVQHPRPRRSDGEYMRILGRKSELINVGGEKVHPTEIENVLLQMENVKDVTVRGTPNPITGEVVLRGLRPCAPRRSRRCSDDAIRAVLSRRLERYKVPAVIEMVDADHHGVRFKKSRKAAAEVDPPSIE